MSSGANENGLNEIDLEALRWLALMERGPLPAQEQRRFAVWVNADPRHKGAIIRARSASLRLDRLAALAGGRSVLQSLPQRAILPRVNTTRRRMLAAAALAAVLVGGGAWLEHDWIQERWGATRYVSNVGELKKVVLQDGSVLTMNTQSELLVRYTGARRDVSLVRGEAMFAVAPDARRPFAVRVGSWSALALGTAFAVRRLDEATTDITVTEGIVQVLPRDDDVSAAPPRLTANQRARVSRTEIDISAIPATEMAAQLAWRNHLVVFSGTPLSQALAEINRYSPRRITVADPELAQRRIVGVFSTVDTQTFVSAMEATLGVEAVESHNTVLLRTAN